ncbi:MAG TPA: PilZ domain-containing protein [bacterium]|nr:PilZ domain-containing protein [bacterium]
MANQRRYERVAFAHSSTLTVHGKPWAVTLVDVSLNGALVELPEQEGEGLLLAAQNAPGQPAQLIIELDGGVNEAPRIVMDVLITWRRGQRLGLSLQTLDVESVTHLRRLLELNLGDASLVERELGLLGPA